MHLDDARRTTPRVPVDGLCGVVSGDALLPAAMLDLSSAGVRLELPFDPRSTRRTVQLEIELPSVDEIVWASGEVMFARFTPMGGRHPDGAPRFWCRAGLHLDAVARREQRLLRDYVFELRRARRHSAAARARRAVARVLAA